MTEATSRIPRRRLVPAEAEDVTETVAQDFVAEVENRASDEQVAPWDEGITPNSWPSPDTDTVSAPATPLFAAALAMHAEVYARIFTTLILHNGIDSPGVAQYAAEGAQSVADYAAVAYRPFDPDFESDE